MRKHDSLRCLGVFILLSRTMEIFTSRHAQAGVFARGVIIFLSDRGSSWQGTGSRSYEDESLRLVSSFFSHIVVRPLTVFLSLTIGVGAVFLSCCARITYRSSKAILSSLLVLIIPSATLSIRPSLATHLLSCTRTFAIQTSQTHHTHHTHHTHLSLSLPPSSSQATRHSQEALDPQSSTSGKQIKHIHIQDLPLTKPVSTPPGSDQRHPCFTA